MKNLMHKEWKLAMQPPAVVFEFMGAMLLIPSYPYLITFFYGTLGIFFICLTGRENHDVEYTALLPVTRTDIVKARITLCVCTEIIQLGIAAIFAMIHVLMPHEPNSAGMDPNLAFFGFAFLLLGFFNLVFFPMYYRNPRKVGISYLIAAIVYGVGMMLCEALVMVPVSPLHILTGYDASTGAARASVLIAGGIIYALLTWAACRISVPRFDRVDIVS